MQADGENASRSPRAAFSGYSMISGAVGGDGQVAMGPVDRRQDRCANITQDRHLRRSAGSSRLRGEVRGVLADRLL